MKKIVAVACVAFAVGMLAGELRHRYDIVLVKPAQAAVDGKDYYQLMIDIDFRHAVKSLISKKYIENIIEDCVSNGPTNLLSC